MHQDGMPDCLGHLGVKPANLSGIQAILVEFSTFSE